jgi:predicted RNase H-like HicB family nuclease
MDKLTVIVEFAKSNYAAYVAEIIGCVATGKTFEELRNNIEEAIKFHIEGMKEDGEEIPFTSPYELSFCFDSKSLFRHYSGIFTNAAMQRLTGINQRQIQRYSSGASRPKEKQSIKITEALHNLGKELLAVSL